MIALISVYIISCILSFNLTVYACRRDNDVSVLDIIKCLLIALVPVFNTFSVMLFIVCIIHDHYEEGDFAFLNKVVIKRKI